MQFKLMPHTHIHTHTHTHTHTQLIFCFFVVKRFYVNDFRQLKSTVVNP